MFGDIVEESLRMCLGKEYRDDGMRALVSEWNDWYTGAADDFHTVAVNNGVAVVRRPMYRLRMAKKVAENWADLLFSEKTLITAGDAGSACFLLGADGSGGILGENSFRTEANMLIEKAFALGTGAVTVNLENAAIMKDGTLLSSPGAKITLDYISAENIFPLSGRGGRAADIAFASIITVNGARRVYIQIHRLEKNGYRIYGRMYSAENGLHEVSLPEGIAPIVKTGSKRPWFVLVRPNTVNNLVPDSPMGMSVYSSAVDILKGIDLCYDSLNMEFYLGKKMVFLRKDMLEQDGDGNFFAPQDSNRQLFMYVGDKNIDGDMLPQEFNPELRVSAHTEALREQLRYLSSKCGFGERGYSFDDGRVTTATQVISENSGMFRTLRKHESGLEKSLITLMRTLLYIGKTVIGEDVNPDTMLTVIFDDSIIEDRPSEKASDLELVKNGIMTVSEFRKKYFGEDTASAAKNTGIDNDGR